MGDAPQLHPGDFDWCAATWGCPASARLAIGHGDAAALDSLALVLDDRLWLVHQRARNATLEALVRHAVAFRRTLAGRHPEATLEIAVLDEDDVAAPVLSRFGFAPEREFADLLALDLDVGARGAGVGTLGAADELPADEWLALHASVFAAMPLDQERLAALRQRAGYVASLDVVLRADDGRPAAFAIAWECAASRDVWIEPLGTAPTYRGAGYAQALVGALCVRCAELGSRRILLAIEPHNDVARRVYERAGFVRIARQTLWRAWV